MASKRVIAKASDGLFRGVNELARVVSRTYGPKGRNVVLERAGGFLSTKDGATVAWEVRPADAMARLGVQCVQAASGAVGRDYGDGTTTTVILAHALFEAGKRAIAANCEPMALASGLLRLGEEIERYGLLAEHGTEVTEDLLFDIALCASNRDEAVARALVEAVAMAGTAGMIVVEEGKGCAIDVVRKAGLEIDRGWETIEAAGDQPERVLETPFVVLVDGMLSQQGDVALILETATQFPHPLVIVSRGCFAHALRLIVANDRKLRRGDGGLFEAVAVRVPGQGAREHLEDLAALTGAALVDLSLRPFDTEMFGAAQSISVKRTASTFIAYPDRYDAIERRVAWLLSEAAKAPHSYDAETLRRRAAMLSDGLVLVRVGATTHSEIRERRGRIEDALHAVQGAVKAGVVPGAGMALLALSVLLEEQGKDPAVSVLVEALRAPLRVLVRNGGREPGPVLGETLAALRASVSPWIGWDVVREQRRDLREAPVLADPYLVVLAALRAAISVAATLLTTELAVVE